MGMIDPVNVAAMFIPAGAVARGGSIAETAGRFALANAAGGVASRSVIAGDAGNKIGDGEHFKRSG